VSDDSGGYPGAPPDWYPDPAGGPGQRWWDGYAWTDATVLPAAPPPPPASPSAAAPPAALYPGAASGYPSRRPGSPTQRDWRGLVADELRISPRARIGIAFPAIVTLVEVISWVASASQWRTFGHQFHVALDAAQNHQPAPVLTAPDSFGGLTAVVVLFGLAAVVLDCVWQFRAATAARAMGLPATQSPGWGVAFWFIPIVNFWMPYLAIRDCLAPGDPNRTLILRYWLLFVAMCLSWFLTIVGLMISTPVGEVFALCAGVCAVGVLATAPKVVTCIATAHWTAANP
jgi:hypothetical protein